MELVTVAQMKAADNNAIHRMGIPAGKLMSNAAGAVAEKILSVSKNNKKFRTVVFCGPGNNGGDGWATAVILHENSIDTTVYSGCGLHKLTGDASFFAEKAFNKNIKIEINTVPESIRDFDVVIDALFGIGLSRKISGIYKKYIDLINRQAKYVISVDIPSGLYSDEGIPYDSAVVADLTICFGKAKVSLFSQPGCEYSKKIIASSIGIPEESYQNKGMEYLAVDMDFARKRLVPREKISSKGMYGKVLVIAGSPGMTGAISLCAEASFRSGTGLVYCAVPKSKIFEYDALLREAISIPVEDAGKPYISSDSTEDILRESYGKSAVIIGPGLFPGSNSGIIYRKLAKNIDIPVIADAQTLNDLSENKNLLKDSKCKAIITPHPGEMARLTGKSIENIQKNRIKTAVEFAKKYNVIVLLKGHKTLVTDGDRVFLNTTGNPGMATAGSGDVLCGIIASATAVCGDLTEAVALGAYIHGAAGDLAADKYGEYGMKAGDILAEIPNVQKNITGA